MKKLYTLSSITFILLSFTILTQGLFAQNVTIPDANFKAMLVANLAINTNADTEIQVSEAAAYAGTINASSMGISNLTGIEAFTAITRLDCGFNSLTSLDLTYNVTLTTVKCTSNMLTSLNVSNLPLLDTLYCNINYLTCLDVSSDTALTFLNCNTNNLTSLNLKNGHNATLSSMVSTSNSMLYCIQVDNVAQAIAAGWPHDTWSSYNTTCGAQTIADFTSDAPVCCGTAVTFTDQSISASSWYWDFDDGTSSTLQNPTHIYPSTGNFNVSLITHNCNSADTTSSIIVQGTDIYGHVSYTGGDVTNGQVIIYPYIPFYTSFDTCQIQPLDGSGNYTFTNIMQGDYIIKVFADPVAYPTLINTYFDNQWTDWDSAVVFTHSCTLNDAADIVMAELAPMAPGVGLLQGYVIEGPGFDRTEGDPVHGVDVKLGVTGTAQIVATTTTDNSGQYTFNNVGFGDYTIYIDIPGLERDSSYHLIVDTANNQFLNLYYVVDSIQIYIVPGIGIEDISSTDHNQLNVFPNPVKDNTIIQYTISSAANVQVSVYNIYGIKVQSLVNAHLQNGEYVCNFNPKNNGLKPGVYFITLSADGKTKTKRIVVME